MATLAVFPTLLALGFWQLERAEEKRVLAAAYTESQKKAPVEITSALKKSGESFQWLPIDGSGEYAAVNILLDNRIRNRVVGYEVLTPLMTNGITVLVNRGWIAAQNARSEYPQIEQPLGRQRYFGNLGPIPTTGIAINEHSTDIEQLAMNVFRVQQINFALLSEKLQRPLLNGVIYLDPKAPHGYVREWSAPGFNPQKHEAYATQWFVMALIVAALYVVLNLEKKPDESL
ncbi:MAG: SURF1 family protein [Gammaproteobacteria bacterium]